MLFDFESHTSITTIHKKYWFSSRWRRKQTKHANFRVGVQYPLKDNLSCLDGSSILHIEISSSLELFIYGLTLQYHNSGNTISLQFILMTFNSPELFDMDPYFEWFNIDRGFFNIFKVPLGNMLIYIYERFQISMLWNDQYNRLDLKFLCQKVWPKVDPSWWHVWFVLKYSAVLRFSLLIFTGTGGCLLGNGA